VNGAAYRDFEFSAGREGLPIVKIAELKAGITEQTRFTLNNPGERYRLANGDILFSWSGNPDTSIDTFCWLNGAAWLNQHIFKVIPPSAEERTFLLCLLRELRPMFAEIARDKQTTGLGHVTAGDMKRLQVVEPSRAILAAFDRTVGPLVRSVDSRRMQSSQLGALRDALLPKLLSGELRIPEAERIVGKAV
jgi:type I restriction enzyme S subunit